MAGSVWTGLVKNAFSLHVSLPCDLHIIVEKIELQMSFLLLRKMFFFNISIQRFGQQQILVKFTSKMSLYNKGVLFG
jgi:hypothetical protein